MNPVRLCLGLHSLSLSLGPSHKNRLHVNNVRVRGQAGPYTQHKCDGVPPRNETTAVAMLVTSDPLEVGDRPRRKSRRTLRHPGRRPAHALDDRCQPGTPPPTTLGVPRERGCPLQPQKHGRGPRTSSTLQHHSPGGGPGDRDLQLHCI